MHNQEVIGKKRIYRIIKMITMLNSNHKNWTANKIADFFDISVRTFHRDRKAIEDLGIPLYYDRETKSYHIVEDYHFSSPNLSSEEARALVLAAKEHDEGDFVYHKELKTALSKVVNSLPESFKKELSNMNQMFKYLTTPHIDFEAHKEKTEKLQKAIEEKKKVLINYFSLRRGKKKERIVDPYNLFIHNGAIYLVAYCNLREKVLMFRVDRIKEFEIKDDQFTLPADFSLEDYMESVWGVERGEEMEVVLRFTGRAAYLVREFNWHDSQEIEEIADDEILFYITTVSREELKSWILGYGSEVEVLEPEDFRQEIIAEINKMYKVYN